MPNHVWKHFVILSQIIVSSSHGQSQVIQCIVPTVRVAYNNNVQIVMLLVLVLEIAFADAKDLTYASCFFATIES